MRILICSAVVAMATWSPAQSFIGHAYNLDVSAATRGFLQGNAGEVMTRLDSTENAGWGADTPGMRTVRSIACIVQDLDAGTPEYFDVKLYPENAAKPGFPDLTAAVTFVLGAPGPTGSGGIATLRVITPAAPVAVPIQASGDVFVSFVLPVATSTDGLSMQVLLGSSIAPYPRWDTPSMLQGGTPPPPASPANSHLLSRIGSVLTYSQRRQLWLDVAHTAAGGIGLAITNQANYPSSGNAPAVPFGPAPGSASFMSGSFPDANGSNPGRADDVAMEYFRYSLGTGHLVVFLLDQDFTANWGPELSLAALFVGSTGWSCLVNPDIIGFAQSTSHEAWLVTLIPANIRPLLLGFTAKQQAVGIDLAGNFHASACDAMRF